MAQLDPEFEIMNEAQDMIVKMCDMYPDKLGHVDPNLILVAAINNKDKPETQTYDASIVGIKAPVTLCTQKRYVIYFYKKTWDGYTPAQRAMMLLSKVLRIDEECAGKVIPEDLKDVKCLVKAFGVDYTNAVSLPDILQEKQIF